MASTITSVHNPTVKQLVKLRQRRDRVQQQRVVIDGARALRLALHNHVTLEALYVAEPTAAGHADLLQQAQDAGVMVQLVTTTVFHKIGYGEHPDGVLGIAPQPSRSLAQLPQAPQALYLVAEGFEKPGNLGAILRTADAAGVTGVLVCDSHTDIWNPNVIRASRGTCFTVALAIATAAETHAWLSARQVQLLAASPTASRLYTAADFRLPTAIILGAEHAGLSAVWQHEAGIHIPMAGQADSLNVAHTAAIVLFEAVRQRHAARVPAAC